MFLEVTNATYIDNYRISLDFNDRAKKVVDLKDEINAPVFEPLKNIEYFKSFEIKYNTIEWENGADFAPEYLYEIGN